MRTMTDEQKKAWAEDMKRRREAKKAPKETVLDLTKQDKNFAVEGEFVRWIQWEFDEGRFPELIKVTSHQAIVIAEFTSKVPVVGYNSPFGSHRIQVVPAKDLNETQE